MGRSMRLTGEVPFAFPEKHLDRIGKLEGHANDASQSSQRVRIPSYYQNMINVV
jgi:hypothetical protein